MPWKASGDGLPAMTGAVSGDACTTAGGCEGGGGVVSEIPEIVALRRDRVFEPYPEATHLVRLDDAERELRSALDRQAREIVKLAAQAGEPPIERLRERLREGSTGELLVSFNDATQAVREAAAAATAAERERTEEAYRLAAEYREKAREATALLRPKCLSCRGTGLQADGRYQELKCEACGGTGRTGEYDAAVQAIAAAERGRTGELEAALHAARAFVNWHAEGPCGCDGEPDDQCDSCRALAVLDLIEKGDTDA